MAELRTTGKKVSERPRYYAIFLLIRDQYFCAVLRRQNSDVLISLRKQVKIPTKNTGITCFGDPLYATQGASNFIL